MTRKPAQILVGIRVDRYPPKYYLGFPGTCVEGDFRSVRALLCARLERMENRAAISAFFAQTFTRGST